MPKRVIAFGDGSLQLLKGNLIIFKRWVKAKEPLRIGEMIEVLNEEEEPIACGIWDSIGLRVLEFSECPQDVETLVSNKLSSAKRIRERMGYEEVYRLIHGDGDLFPGLIIDVYGPLAVIQSSSLAVDVLLPIIIESLVRVTGVDTVAEKSVQRVRSKSKLPPKEVIHKGKRKEVVVEVDKEGIKYVVTLKSRKTGLYLDQRENRVYARRFSKSGSFLDLFSYTGGFGLNALHEGASKVVFVDRDPEALSLLRRNLKLNGFEESRTRIVREDAFKFLKKSLKRGSRFQVSSVDPPALMDDYKSGLKMYRELYALSSTVTSDISILSSCSRSFTLSMFKNTLFDVLEEPYRLLEIRGSAPDHPTRRGLEDYLKVAYVALGG